jgi:hypothetical protein
MACGRCALRWSTDDPDPPACLQHERRARPRVDVLPLVPAVLVAPPVPPERRHAHELHQAREAAARRVDYRGLLAKYMRHMAAEQGSTGVAWVGGDGRGYFSGVVFSPEEVAALKVCADELAAG